MGWGNICKIKKNLDAPDETDLPMVMKAHSNLEEIIQKSVETKGELEDMIKIDKSKSLLRKERHMMNLSKSLP